jgi:spoIIIJ-associated protein
LSDAAAGVEANDGAAEAPIDPAAGSSADDSGEEAEDESSLLVREGDIAADYLEHLLDVLDYDGDIDLDVENGRAMVAIIGGSGLKPLIGQRGATLDALQELTRLAVQQKTGVRSRLMLDVGEYRANRRAELTELARKTADDVTTSGERRALNPMNAFERKVVHDAIAALEGVRSESEGEDPQRRVVVSPA